VRQHAQLLNDRHVQGFVHLNHLARLLQQQRICREYGVGVLGRAVLLGHVDVFRVDDLVFHLIPDTGMLQRFHCRRSVRRQLRVCKSDHAYVFIF